MSEGTGETQAGPAGPEATGLLEEVAPAAPPEATPEEISSSALLGSILERVDALRQGIDEANRLSADRERIVDRLHAEVQSLRAGELEQALSPALRELIRLYDQSHRAAQDLASRGATSDVIGVIEGLRDEVSDALFRQGVEMFDAEPGTRFDPKEQRAVAAVVALDPSLAACIAKVVRNGFRRGSRILRPLEVEVFRLPVPAMAASQTAGPTST